MTHYSTYYFETSAVNYYYDNVFGNDKHYSSLKTKQLQLNKKRKWYISAIVLWELFLSKDKKRRNELFDFSRKLFYDYLMPSPEEIIINYIKSGMNITEKKYLLRSESVFAKEWEKACSDLNYWFEPNEEQLIRYTKHLRLLGDILNKATQGYVLQTFRDIDSNTNKIHGAFLKSIWDKVIKELSSNPDEKSKLYVYISIHITMFILCYGLCFDQKIIENFWKEKRIESPLARLEYCANNYIDIFFRGPIGNISLMILHQISSRFNRGMYFDSLHTIYISYSDLFFTNDSNLPKIIDTYDHFNMRKIISVKDTEVVNIQTDFN